MYLRISSGIYKNRRLKTIPGKEFRPLSERVKLAVFSILGDKIKDSNFLDLFGGTGNVGLEALSRGAKSVVFVEKESKKIELIKSNVSSIGVDEKVEIIQSDVFNYKTQSDFDIVFAGPPYKVNFSTKILNHLKNNNIVKKDTILILQHHFKEEIDADGYNVIDKRKYGITEIVFLILNKD
jgi:16S rRNA (guanine966-N2)-methyltransferase